MTIVASDVMWVVTDEGEVGVKIEGKVFTYYKGSSLEVFPFREDGTPVMVRQIERSEFTYDVIRPAHVNLKEGEKYTFFERHDWLPIVTKTIERTPAMILADALHENKCTCDHKNCIWNYFSWESQSPAHMETLAWAERILEHFTLEQALELVNAYVFFKE